MKVIQDKSFVALIEPKLAGHRIQLSQRERDTLCRALAICQQAGILEADFLERAELPGDYNSWEWARFYLDEALELSADRTKGQRQGEGEKNEQVA